MMQIRTIRRTLERTLLDVGLAVVIFLAERQLVRRQRQRSARRLRPTLDAHVR